MARADDESKEDSGGGMNAMEKLLLMADRSESVRIESHLSTYPSDAPGSCHTSSFSNYVSVVKFCGKPILPPVMTPERCEEMRQYRQQAQITETRLRAKAKQKLLARVQLIMAEIDDRHGTSSFDATSECDITTATVLPTDHTTTPLVTGDIKLRLDSPSSESSQHVAENVLSPQRVDTVDSVNTPSPRRTDAADKNTPDSGISSKDPTRTTDNLREESAMLDTLADITNISSEEEEDLLIRTMAGVKLLSGGTDVQKLAKVSGSEITCSPPSKIPVLVNVKHDVDTCQLPSKDRSLPQTLATDQQAILVQVTSSKKGSDGTVVQTKPVCQQDMPHKTNTVEIDKGQVTHPTTVAEKLSLAFQGQVARNQSQHAAGNSIKSSSSSGTTLSSDEMNQTVIAKSESLPHPNVSGASHVVDGLAGCPITSYGSPQGKPVITGLLGKVALDSDTPDDCFQHMSPGGAFIEASDVGPVFNVEFTVHEQAMSLKADHHASVTERKLDSDPSLTALAHSMAVTERTKSCDLSFLCTDSTELAAYMVSNADSMKTSITTLPHLLDMTKCDDPDKSPMDVSLSQQNVSAGTSNGKKMGESLRKHVRRSSYTLEHPSPALLAQTLTPAVAGDTETFELTSSMEDLKLKPVQRRLSYADTDVGQGTVVTEDKCVNNSNKDMAETQDTVAKEAALVKDTVLTEGVIGEGASGKEMAADSREEKTTNEIGGKVVDTREHNPGGKTVESREHLPGGKTAELRVHKRGMKETVVREGQQARVTTPAVTCEVAVSSELALGRDKPSLHDEREGKEEHLHRYLHTLSQMPPLTNPSDDDELHNRTETCSIPEMGDLNDTNTNSLVAPLDIDALASLSEDDLLKVQQLYFEKLREQLVQQQQSQLATLLAEQQKQQMLFQKEILAQEHDLLSQHRTSGDTSRHDSGDTSRHTSGDTSRHSGQSRKPSKTAERKKVVSQEERKKRRRSNQENGRYKHHSESMRDNGYVPSLANCTEMNGYGRYSSGITRHSDYTDATPDNSVLSIDRVSTIGPLETDQRPVSAPKVSFDMSSVSDDHRRCHTPERRHHSGHQLAVGWADRSYTSPLVTLSRMSSPHRSSTPQHHRSRPSPHCKGARHRLHLPVDSQNIPAEVQLKLEKMSAAVKGYLTRRLLASEKVQQIIKTIKDTAEFALSFQQESPIKKGIYSDQDRQLQARVLAQLTAAMYEIHEIFFELPMIERMAIIQMSRMLEREKFFRPEVEPQRKSPGVSAATLKTMARKRKIKAAEKAVCERTRPKSAPPDSSWNSLRGPIRSKYEFKTSRALRPKHAMASPIKPTKDSINRLVAKKQQTVPAKRRLLHSRLPSKAALGINNAIGDSLQKKGSKVVMKRVTAAGGGQMGDGNDNATTQHKVAIPRVTVAMAAVNRPKVKSVR